MIIAKTLLAAAAISVGGQADGTYEIDASHTNIIWSADHLGFSKSFGTFTDISGEFTLDGDAPQNSMVEVTVKPASITTGIPKFDAHLKNADFFDVEKYETVVFKSTNVETTGEKTAKIHGELTMLGQTHPLTLEATLNKIGTNPFNKKQTAGFSLTGSIDRSQYGMDYAVPGVPAEVGLIIEAEGTLKD